MGLDELSKQEPFRSPKERAQEALAELREVVAEGAPNEEISSKLQSFLTCAQLTREGPKRDGLSPGDSHSKNLAEKDPLLWKEIRGEVLDAIINEHASVVGVMEILRNRLVNMHLPTDYFPSHGVLPKEGKSVENPENS